jgi:predicted adenine nucleotide alpha hydrolase (AANH) superfamily ATPase
MNILLHVCCSNCSLYPIKILRSGNHDFTGFWFNPNIQPYEEYQARLASLKKLSDLWQVDILYNEEYKPEEYFGALGITDKTFLSQFALNSSNGSNGLNGIKIPPSPDRCRSCYQLRLEKTAEEAKKGGFDAFTTTLLISPYQDFEQIRETGNNLAEKYNVMFHMEDFRPFFRDAMNLAKELDLYRQKYCGCIFSREERFKSKGHRDKGA